MSVQWSFIIGSSTGGAFPSVPVPVPQKSGTACGAACAMLGVKYIA